MERVTFLGPVGATFSHDAYNSLARIYGAPMATNENCLPAGSNEEVVKMIINHGGYGAIAMETRAEGRVAGPLEAFIDLLKLYPETRECPIQVVGAVKQKLHFCLMARKGERADTITKILAHPKALGACRGRIANVQTVGASSNGEAARLVAETDEYKTCGALGPRSASEKYGLTVLDEAFEDGEAVTTFFLIGPSSCKVSVGKENRLLLIFRVPHEPGALVHALTPFERAGLNMIQIHSVHTGNHTYDFAIELEIKKEDLKNLNGAMSTFRGQVTRHVAFGPFEVK